MRISTRLALATVALALGALAIAGCGDDAGSGDTTASVPATTATSTSADGSAADDDGSEGAAATPERGTAAAGKAPVEDPAAAAQMAPRIPPSDPGADFAAQLRSIVGGTLAELRPLAAPALAMGDPAEYAEQLATGRDQLDDAIAELEALDPPADAEEGTGQVIDAFKALRDAVATGAEDLGSGDGARVTSGLAKLRRAAAAFSEDILRASETLRNAGYGVAGG